jgi:hypothetical protein
VSDCGGGGFRAEGALDEEHKVDSRAHGASVNEQGSHWRTQRRLAKALRRRL